MRKGRRGIRLGAECLCATPLVDLHARMGNPSGHIGHNNPVAWRKPAHDLFKPVDQKVFDKLSPRPYYICCRYIGRGYRPYEET